MSAPPRRPPPPPRRRRRWGRALLIVLLVVIFLPLIGGAILYASFDPNTLKPRIAAAVERATGRTVTLAGPISWQLAPVPMLAADRVSLANPPGASRAQMLTVRRVEIRAAWLPLLSGQVQITGLRLIRPDLLLERTAQGVPNWVFSPPASGKPSAVPALPASAHASRVDLRGISVLDGVIGWRDKAGSTVTAAVPELQARASGPDGGRVAGSGLAIASDVPVRISLEAGPARPGSGGAGSGGAGWPAVVTVAALGADLRAAATLPGPYRVAGGHVDLTATASDLATMAPLAELPPLRDVRAQAQLALGGSGRPTLTGLRVQAGASDLSAIVPGLRLTSLDAAARSATGPVELVAHGSFGRTPLSLQGSAGPLPALLPGALAPASVNFAGSAGPATLALKGSIASPRALSGKDLALAVQVPDLAAFPAPGGPSLPALKKVSLRTWIGDAPGGVALHDLVLTAPAGDLEGNATLGRADGRPVLRATLTSSRLDLDALRRLLGTGTPAAPATAAAPAPPPAAQAAAKPAAPPAAKPATARPLISERPLNLALLRAADADLHLTIAVLHTGGADWRDVSGHLLDVGGNLALAPFAALLPGGAVDGTFSLDATKAAPPVALTLHAPALAIGPTLDAFGLAPAITGDAQLDLDLHGSGVSLHAIAAGLGGHLGFALVDGDIANSLLEAALGDVLRTAKLSLGAGEGRTRLRCVALRLSADGGRAVVRALAVDTSRVAITGTGSIDLRAETFDLQLQPRLRLGKLDAATPLDITGLWRAPKVSEQRGADGRVAVVIGAPDHGDSCTPALSVARGGQPGPMPAPRAPEHGIQPGDILRLLRHHG